jgi:hypothetical protein
LLSQGTPGGRLYHRVVRLIDRIYGAPHGTAPPRCPRPLAAWRLSSPRCPAPPAVGRPLAACSGLACRWLARHRLSTTAPQPLRPPSASCASRHYHGWPTHRPMCGQPHGCLQESWAPGAGEARRSPCHTLRGGGRRPLPGRCRAWSSFAPRQPIGRGRGRLLGSGNCVVCVAMEPEAVHICSARCAGHAGPSAAGRHP